MEQGITTVSASDDSFAPKLTYIRNAKIVVKFKGNCLKQDKVSFTHRNIVNYCYELDIWSRDLNTNFTLKDCLFGVVKLTKNVDPDNRHDSDPQIAISDISFFFFFN